MNEGFVRLGRSFFDHYLWAEERVFSRAEAWLDLVAQGAYEPHKRMVAGRLVEVPRGGIVASERFLSDRWQWSRTKVRAFLDLLRSDSMIEVKKDHEATIVVLCNYETYNGPSTGKKPQKNQRKTTKEPPGDQREEGKEGEDSLDADASASKPFSRPSREVFDQHVLTEMRRTQMDADHVWNTWTENGWTRAQAGKRVAIQYWRMALATWETGGHFPSQKGINSNAAGQGLNAANPAADRNRQPTTANGNHRHHAPETHRSNKRSREFAEPVLPAPRISLDDE